MVHHQILSNYNARQGGCHVKEIGTMYENVHKMKVYTRDLKPIGEFLASEYEYQLNGSIIYYREGSTSTFIQYEEVE